ILKTFFGSCVIKVNTEKLNKEEKKTNGFSVVSLESFFNHDAVPIKKTLNVFLEDTKKNRGLLKQAHENNDMQVINTISHKMLSMFKQLEVKAVIPFLETFETSTAIVEDDFVEFENVLNDFIYSLEKYIN